MRKLFWSALAALALTSGTAAAQNERSTFIADNGVELVANIDETANVVEYSSPDVEFRIGDFAVPSSAFVTRLGTLEELDEPMVSFLLAYQGVLRGHNAAALRGGELVAIEQVLAEEIGCNDAQRQDCIWMELVRVFPTADQIQRLGKNGQLAIEISGVNGRPTTVEIPLEYFEALNSM